jgi:hypothetical protein
MSALQIEECDSNISARALHPDSNVVEFFGLPIP